MEITMTETKWPKTLFDDTEPRAEGIHLSDITHSILDALDFWKGKGGFTDMQLTAEIGLLWEVALSKIMRDKYALRPPQICLDGIWMSPDGIGPDPEGIVPLVVEEYKATWQSTKRSPIDQLNYMMQLKSYCHALDTTIGIMHIFHIMGDYRGSGPIYRVARIMFTRYELEENWKMILKHKKEVVDK